MASHTFFCLDGHTCGNPVRLVAGGGPYLVGGDMVEKRAHFMAEFDWIRRALCFEPRGHDMMSGVVLYPPTRPDCDVAFLFIETSGCLPMCGHGTIGAVTMALERGLVTPRLPGLLRIDTPAGVVEARYVQNGPYVDSVRITNVASFLHEAGLSVDVPGLGRLVVDIAYGGNFYAIVEPQENYSGLDDVTPADLIVWSRALREALAGGNRGFVHPDTPAINGVRHIMWTGAPHHPEAHARNAVFYGEKAIDRSPCGTGTSARMAQWAARGRLGMGDAFVHESIIGTLFHGRVEQVVERGIVPSIEGWARLTGHNTIFVDDRDPLRHGFTVS